MLLALATLAAAAEPFVLPPGEGAPTWGPALGVAGFEVGTRGDVTLAWEGETAVLRVKGADGRVREARVARPRTEIQREDVAWLARSLRDEGGGTALADALGSGVHPALTPPVTTAVVVTPTPPPSPTPAVTPRASARAPARPPTGPASERAPTSGGGSTATTAAVPVTQADDDMSGRTGTDPRGGTAPTVDRSSTAQPGPALESAEASVPLREATKDPALSTGAATDPSTGLPATPSAPAGPSIVPPSSVPAAASAAGAPAGSATPAGAADAASRAPAPVDLASPGPVPADPEARGGAVDLASRDPGPERAADPDADPVGADAVLADPDADPADLDPRPRLVRFDAALGGGVLVRPDVAPAPAGELAIGLSARALRADVRLALAPDAALAWLDADQAVSTTSFHALAGWQPIRPVAPRIEAGLGLSWRRYSSPVAPTADAWVPQFAVTAGAAVQLTPRLAADLLLCGDRDLPQTDITVDDVRHTQSPWSALALLELRYRE